MEISKSGKMEISNSGKRSFLKILKGLNYLKDFNLLAISYDKGIGICVMQKNVYQQKLDYIIPLRRFERVLRPGKTRNIQISRSRKEFSIF